MPVDWSKAAENTVEDWPLSAPVNTFRMVATPIGVPVTTSAAGTTEVGVQSWTVKVGLACMGPQYERAPTFMARR